MSYGPSLGRRVRWRRSVQASPPRIAGPYCMVIARALLPQGARPGAGERAEGEGGGGIRCWVLSAPLIRLTRSRSAGSARAQLLEVRPNQRSAVLDGQVAPLTLPDPEPRLRDEICVGRELLIGVGIRPPDHVQIAHIQRVQLEDPEQPKALVPVIPSTHAQLDGMEIRFELPTRTVDALLQRAHEQHEELPGPETRRMPGKRAPEKFRCPRS